jgi:hypothetical protein
MTPSVWGGAEWTSLLALVVRLKEGEGAGAAAVADPALRDAVAARMRSLGTLMVCPSCREHFVAHLATHPLPPVLTSTNLLAWLRVIYAAVGARKAAERRRSTTLSAQQAARQYHVGHARRR